MLCTNCNTKLKVYSNTKVDFNDNKIKRYMKCPKCNSRESSIEIPTVNFKELESLRLRVRELENTINNLKGSGCKSNIVNKLEISTNIKEINRLSEISKYNVKLMEKLIVKKSKGSLKNTFSPLKDITLSSKIDPLDNILNTTKNMIWLNNKMDNVIWKLKKCNIS